MMRSERAKQFQPFDAMKGLREAILDREERYCRVEKHEINEDQIQENSRVFEALKKGNRVHLEYFKDFHDTEADGILTKTDTVFCYLVLNGEEISFENIYKIEITAD